MNSRFHQAESVYRQVADHAETTGSLALQGKALTNLAETLCWTRPDDARSIGDRAVTVNLAAGNQLELVKAHAARAIAASGGDDASRAVETSLELVAQTAYRAGAIFAFGARAFRQLIDGAPEAALATRAEVVRLSGELGVYQFWNELLAWWLAEAGMTVAADGEPAAWLDGPDATRQRWQEVLRQRRR